MEKPVHPIMGLARVAQFISAPGGGSKKKENPAYKIDVRLRKKEYKEALKRYYALLKIWNAEQKALAKQTWDIFPLYFDRKIGKN